MALPAATALTRWFLILADGIHTVARAFHRRFQLLGRGQPLVVLHHRLARRERDRYTVDPLNRVQRVRHIAGAASASHAGYFQVFRLHTVCLSN